MKVGCGFMMNLSLALISLGNSCGGGGKKALLRYYFDSQLVQCRVFTYNGCKGNANRFPTKEKCHQECIEAHSDSDTNNYMVSEIVIGIVVALLLALGVGLAVKYYRLHFAARNENYNIFTNQQTLQRQASTIPTLAYENPAYEASGSNTEEIAMKENLGKK